VGLVMVQQLLLAELYINLVLAHKVLAIQT
jgi:hypothetical protein